MAHSIKYRDKPYKLNPCKFGDTCRFMRLGKCNFYHPRSHYPVKQDVKMQPMVKVSYPLWSFAHQLSEMKISILPVTQRVFRCNQLFDELALSCKTDEELFNSLPEFLKPRNVKINGVSGSGTRGKKRAEDIIKSLPQLNSVINETSKYYYALDYGCGAGDVTTHLYQMLQIPMRNTYGIDTHADEKNTAFNYIQSDSSPESKVNMESIPSNVKVASFLMTLHHFDDVTLLSAIKLVSSKMINGGYVIVREHEFESNNSVTNLYIDLEHVMYIMRNNEIVPKVVTYKRPLAEYVKLFADNNLKHLDTVIEMIDSGKDKSRPYDKSVLMIFEKIK